MIGKAGLPSRRSMPIGLPRQIDVADHVENVVDHLEGDAHIQAIAFGLVDQGGMRAGQVGADLSAGVK